MATSEVPFCFPVKILENERLILVPFDTSLHAEAFVDATRDIPELLRYLPYGPFESVKEFRETFYDLRIGSSESETLFAIFVKGGQQQKEAFAGVVGYLNASAKNAALEIGFITILPAFQRSFVTSNAVGLLLLYAMDLPPHGLGLRRCQWQTHAENVPSRRVSERMLFTFEGVQRFQRTVPPHKAGNGFDVSRLPDVMGKQGVPSRDSAVFAHYCDEWPDKRDQVVAIMDRKK